MELMAQNVFLEVAKKITKIVAKIVGLHISVLCIYFPCIFHVKWLCLSFGLAVKGCKMYR